MKSLYISAAHKSSGKTTFSIGLSAALTAREMQVQTYKKGPDYIDPKWLEKATGRPSYNLDFNTMDHDEIVSLVNRKSHQADYEIVEGNLGLYDGVDLHGKDSNAAMVNLLDIPVLLVLDCSGITRGIAPLLTGYQQFDTTLKFAGVVINKVAGARHEQKLRAVIETYTDLPVLGAIGRNSEFEIRERHLGLVPSNEEGEAEKIIHRLSSAVRSSVDIDKVVESMSTARKTAISDQNLSAASSSQPVKIAIIRDAAFGFYYPDDLEALQRQGAELVTVDATQATSLPEVDGLFIGGGFPETQAAALARNNSLRESIRTAIENDLPVYAECGGLMYLTRSIAWAGKQYDMVGAIEADTVMYDRPVGRGYAKLQPLSNAPWFDGDIKDMAEIPAHEFHYSRLENIDSPFEFAYEVLRGEGIDGKHDGIICRNLLANYAHLRDTSRYHWTEYFIKFIRKIKGANL